MAFTLFKKKEPKFKPVQEKAEPVQAASTPSLAAPAISSVLRHFFVSEKSARGQSLGQYTFVVAPTATKSDVKHAVQRAYKVSVAEVNIVRLPSKKRTIGRYRGTTSAIKKAIVTLKEGQTIAQAQP